ncbi:MAG: hypothetical protein EXR98_06620 [Gemmataceae bacterium]|nr:hypothetical protein [Gemmataceae bacterium]
MFRKILIALVASLGCISPFAIAAQTEANYIVVHRHHHHRYHVYYRNCSHEAWRCAGSFGCHDDAFREVHILRHRGFEVVLR